jgi:phosphomevalonate kinase
MSKIIGITGYGRSGKDTFAEMAAASLAKTGAKSQIVSFAYSLKETLDPLLRQEFGISAFTNDNKEKEIIRPFLVAWATECRKKDEAYFIKKVDSKCREALSNGQYVLLPDLRFLNEGNWVKGFKKNALVIVSRKEISAPNEQEANNIPSICRKFAPTIVNWPTVDTSASSLLTNTTLNAIVATHVNRILHND